MVVETKEDLDNALTGDEKEEVRQVVEDRLEERFEEERESLVEDMGVDEESAEELASRRVDKEIVRVFEEDPGIDVETQEKGVDLAVRMAQARYRKEGQDAPGWTRIGYNVPGVEGVFSKIPEESEHNTLPAGCFKRVLGDPVTGTAVISFHNNSTSGEEDLEHQFIECLNVMNTAEKMQERGAAIVSDYEMCVVNTAGRLKGLNNSGTSVILVGNYRPPDSIDLVDPYSRNVEEYQDAVEAG